MVVEAGVTLLEAQEAAEAAGRLFPLSLAAEGTATVGGNISTNAGGTAVLRYGVMRDLVLGLEAVLPNGEVFRGLKRLRKDNTGYDLKQLLIGAEGTLGIITAASLKLFPQMRSRATAFVGLEDPAKAIELLMRAKDETGNGVEAFELMGRLGIDFVLKHIPGTREPMQSRYPWYALIEIVSSEPGGRRGGPGAPARPRLRRRTDRRRRRRPERASSRTTSGASARTSPPARSPRARSGSTTSRCRSHASPTSSPRRRRRW